MKPCPKCDKPVVGLVQNKKNAGIINVRHKGPNGGEFVGCPIHKEELEHYFELEDVKKFLPKGEPTDA